MIKRRNASAMTAGLSRISRLSARLHGLGVRVATTPSSRAMPASSTSCGVGSTSPASGPWPKISPPVTGPPPLVVRYSPGYPARSRSRRPHSWVEVAVADVDDQVEHDVDHDERDGDGLDH